MLLLSTLVLAAAALAEKHCAIYEHGSYRVEIYTSQPNCAAVADSDRASLNKTGWMPLTVETSESAANNVQYEAIGVLEGYLFQHHIFNHFHNVKDWFLFAYLGQIEDYPPELFAFLQENLDWTREHARRYARTDRVWRQVSYTLSHFDGLVRGYRMASPESGEEDLSELDLWVYLSSGDLLDIVNFAAPTLRPDFSKMTTEQIQEWSILNSHCSGLFRMNEEGSEVYVGQAAWFFLGSMTRVLKTYKTHITGEAQVAQSLTFSSYPGFSYSFDDFMATDTGLLVIETTNNIYDMELYDRCSSASLLTWIRGQIATRLARNGREWTEIFQNYNSGTYNNQWAVLDVKVFAEKGKDADHDLVWIAEQIPGRITSDDVTYNFVKNGYYWPSVNIPFFEQIFIESGYPTVNENDVTHTYDRNPRSLIFARDAPNVNDLAAMKKIMRYNQFMTDELSIPLDRNITDPGNAIASRYDLRAAMDDAEKQKNAKAFGAFDAKIGMYNRRTEEYTYHFISSPTYDDQEPWTFGDYDLYCPRRGLPDGPYMYEWVDGELDKQF